MFNVFTKQQGVRYNGSIRILIPPLSMTRKKTAATNVPLNIALLAVGRRGCLFLSRLAPADFPHMKRMAIAGAGRPLSTLAADVKIEIAERGRGSAAEVIIEHRTAIVAALGQADMVIALGNVSNSEVAEQTAAVADLVQTTGVLFCFIGALPFAFEGLRVAQTAEKNVALLK